MLGLPFAALLHSARACEFFTSNLRIVHPWTRATADDAETAIVCMTLTDVAQDDHLIGVTTPVARAAEISGSGGASSSALAIPAGQETVLSETGIFVRLLGLKHGMAVGRAYPMQLVFERGGAVNVDLSVDYGRFGLGRPELESVTQRSPGLPTIRPKWRAAA